ncbi:hypothetical protein [Terrisporobacter sp.]|uniref:hypothetical protein n=1 Tax=Terrisporobacter sp. TaxID=1965305 RepID=UPI00289A71C9|nr:hypothetical protein [Terrisporobacter sp.]
MALDKYAGIDVTKPGGELMDTMEILTQLSGKWDGFTKQTKVGLGEAIAGKYHSNVFNALMDNFQTVKDIQDEIASGQALGSADKENKRFIDSIEGRVVKLKEELKKLTTTAISTDMAKGFVSGLTSMVSGINNVISAFDKLGVATPVVLSGLTGMFMTIKSLGTGTQLPNFFKTLSGLATSGSSLNKIQSNLKNTSTQFTTLSRESSKFSGVMRATQGSSNQMSKALQTNRVVATQTANGYSLMSKTASQAKSSLSGMGSMLSGIGSTLLTTFGNMAIMAVAGMAISKITEELYKFAHASEISMEKHEENISKINTKISELKTQKSSLKSISKEYDELANKTNRSAKEQERYNELRNQIAEANPELQSGVDSEGNAILSLNGSLKNYIKSLDSAIEKQRMLLQQQQNAEAGDASDQLQKGGNVAFGYDYKNYQKATMTAEEEKKKIEKSGSNLTDAINSFTAKSENSFDSSVKKIQTAREEHTAQIEDSYNKVAEEQEKINELSSKLKQKALNKIETNTKIEKSSDDIKALAKNITSSLDFSSLKTGQIDTFARNLSNALGDGKDGVLKKYQNLRKEVERTGDTFAYKNGIEEIIPQMSDLLGLNDELVRSMVQLDPTLTQASSSLDAYLQSFGKRESMREFDADTESLAKQYESFNTLMDDLGGLDATKSETNGEVRFDIKAVAEIVNKDDVPKQVKDLFGDMEKDGQFTNEEMEVMMKISAGMTSESPEERSKLLDEAQKMIDELFPDSKIDVGELDVQAEYKMNEDSKNAVSEQIKSLGDEKFVATIETEIHGANDAEKFSQIMSSLQGDKGDIQTFITANIDKLGELKSYEDVVEWLLNNPEIANKYNISVVGADTVDAVAKKVKKLDLSKKEKKQIMVDVKEGDITGLMGKLDKMPPEKKVKVLSEISQAISGIDTVDARVLHDKFTDLLAIDNATGKINYVDEYKKLMNKNVDINADDNASPVINKLDLSTVVKWVQIKAQKIGDFFAGGYQPPVIKNAGGFSNISDTPQEAQPQAMSSGFSGVSDSPTASASAPTPTTGIPTGVSGQVSAKAYAPTDFVSTSATKVTKISTAYKNVWNAIKYGINLFTELENRIKRTQNNLDLLSKKMENAVGTKKIKYLQDQNKLYKEQAKLQNTLYKSLVREKSSTSKAVKKSGFKINKQGNIYNYEEQMIKLEKAAESAEKRASNYNGKSDKKKKSLEKSADAVKTKLDNAKKATERYLELQYTDIPQAKASWQELQNSIKETNNEIERLKFEDKIYKEKNAIDELNNSIKQYSHYRDRLSTKADRSQGATRIKYLKEEAQHLKKLQSLNEGLAKQYASERKDYKSKLGSFGVKFDKNNDQITNYDEILNKYQNSSELEKVKQWMEDYQEVVDAGRDINDQREEYINDMQDLQNEIKKLELDVSLKPLSVSVDVASSKIKRLQNNLDIISVKMEHAYGNDKLNLIKEQIKLYEQLEKEQKISLQNMKKQEEILKKELKKNGFKFNSSGDITNMKDALSKIEKSGAYEYLKEVLDQWKDLHENEIPDADKSIEDFQNSIKDAYKNQLEVTKDIEDKISDMIKKQIEDRKNAIEKETDTIKKELEKRKKAHQDARKEADYQNEYDEKTSEIDKLKEQLETAKRDSSLGNRKKIAELEKQLEDAQKELEKIVDDKLNSDIEDAFDDAIEGVEEENDKKIEDLEKEWTDSKIAEAIKNALDTGLFTDLNGNVTNLQDAMLDFAESSGEALGVMSDVIKNELIANLNVALDTLKNYADISDKLGLNNVNSNLPTANGNSKSVTTGDINIHVTTQSNSNGNDIAKEVKKAVNEALEGAVQGL